MKTNWIKDFFSFKWLLNFNKDSPAWTNFTTVLGIFLIVLGPSIGFDPDVTTDEAIGLLETIIDNASELVGTILAAIGLFTKAKKRL